MIEGLIRVARSQAIVARNVLRGWPITYTGCTAMTIDEDDLQLASSLLATRTGWRDPNPAIAFERAFAEWNGSAHAYGFAGGRVALSAAIEALGLRAGDQVVIPAYTCVVVANAFRNAGIEPVFADIELSTYGLDRDALKSALTPRTKAILIHHLYGLVSRDLADILEIARARQLAVIEDCAQAAGAIYAGRKVGNFGDIGIFSADPSKPITCVQGGIAVTSRPEISEKLASIHARAEAPDDRTTANRLQNLALNYVLNKDPGRWWKADVAWMRSGRDYFYGIPASEVAGSPPSDAGRRLSSPLAQIALNQLKKIDHYNECRRRNARRWDSWCAANGFSAPTVIDESIPMFLRYPVLVRPEMKRDLRWAYRALGVVPGTWFATHLHPAPEVIRDVPNATRAVAECINFPTLYFEDGWPVSR